MSRPMPSHCAGEFLQNSVSNSLPASISPLDRRKLSSGAETTMSRASYKSLKTPKVNLNRKLEMEFNKALASAERRRQKSGNDYKTISSSSSAASSDAENDSHIDLVLTRSRDHLENIQALKKRRDFLRPEDYVSSPSSIVKSSSNLFIRFRFSHFVQAEIIATCRDNRRCLETVLHGPAGTVLSLRRHQHIRGECNFYRIDECNQFLHTIADIVFDLVNLMCHLPVHQLISTLVDALPVPMRKIAADLLQMIKRRMLPLLLL